MSNQTISSVLITTDPEFQETVRPILLGGDRVTRLSLEITAPFSGITSEHLASLRQADPKIIILDFGNEPDVGIRFAQFLTNTSAAPYLLATGPALPAEVLITAMQAGISEYLPKPVGAEGITGALERAERKLGVFTTAASRGPGKLLAFYSAKGGSGCTTIATNVAIHLHNLTGKRTLLVDLDPELGEIALFLGVQPRFNFVDMLRNFHRMDAELLASYIETHDSGVHLLSAPYQPERSEELQGEQIQKVLHFLKQHYDYLVVDTSKSLSPSTLATFAEADEVYLVTYVDLPSLRNIKRCLPVLQGVSGNGGEKVRLVVNRYRAEGPISIRKVEEMLGMKAYGILSNDFETVIESIHTGKPVALNGNGTVFARELKSLGSDIAGLGGIGERPQKQRLKLFLQMFGRKERPLAPAR
jgi:pilus assembly protein CpaE